MVEIIKLDHVDKISNKKPDAASVATVRFSVMLLSSVLIPFPGN